MCIPLIFLLLLLTILFGIFGYKKTSVFICFLSLFILLFVGNGLIPFYLLKYLQPYKNSKIIKWKGYDNTIIVLGTGTVKLMPKKTIKPSLRSFSRITTAAMLYLQCKKSSSHCHIIISGGDSQRNGKTEAAAYRPVLLALGVNNNDIKLEPNSKNTFQNAKFTSKLIEKKLNTRTLLVCSELTMKRALLYFAYFNIYPFPIPSDFTKVSISILPHAYNLALNDLMIHEIVGIARFYTYNFLGWNEKKLFRIDKNS